MKKLEAMANSQGVEIRVVEGGSHTKIAFGGKQTTVPRHREINEITARQILKTMGESK